MYVGIGASEDEVSAVHMPVQYTLNMISLHAETAEEVESGLAACTAFVVEAISQRLYPTERMVKMKVLIDSLKGLAKVWVLGLGGRRNHGVRTTSRNEGENAAQAKDVNVHSRARLGHVQTANKTRLMNRSQTSQISNEQKSLSKPGGGKEASERRHIHNELDGVVLTRYGENLLLKELNVYQGYELVYMRYNDFLDIV